MTLLDDLKASLDADLTVVTQATGGIILNSPDTRQDPGAFDGQGRLRPLVYIALSSHPQRGPYLGSSRAFITTRCYAPTGREAEALARAVESCWNRGEATQIPSLLDLRWLDDPGPLPSFDQAFDPVEIYWPSRYVGTPHVRDAEV